GTRAAVPTYDVPMEPSVAAVEPGRRLPAPLVHLLRVVAPDHPRSAPMRGELARLRAAGHVAPQALRYLAWRRSVLLAILPVLAGAALLAAVERTGRPPSGGLTPIGMALDLVPAVTAWSAPLAALIALASWAQPERRMRLFLLVWGLSVLLPILTAFVPLEVRVESAVLQRLTAASELALPGTAAWVVQLLRTALAADHALVLLPVLFSLPAGALRGGTRLKAFLPFAPLPGWLLVAIAPFSALLTMTIFVLVGQVTGAAMLAVAAVLLALAPLQYVRWRDAWLETGRDPEADRLRRRAGRAGLVCLLAGIVALLAWALGAEVLGIRLIGGERSLLAPAGIARALLELVGRSLLAGIVCAQLLLALTIRHWAALAHLDPAEVAAQDAEARALVGAAGPAAAGGDAPA
ncbi:MAG: hypothetical protein ACKOTZ_13870, partial [Chloroflexota bacterium]